MTIHPSVHISAVARREGCPEDVLPAVVSAVLRTAGQRLADRGEDPHWLYLWADGIDQAESGGAGHEVDA